MASATHRSTPRQLAIIGGGPAGLMAAEVASSAGIEVDVFDAMPSVGRKFLLAGKGGLNLTHAEAPDRFLARYGSAAGRIAPWIDSFGPAALRAWAAGLGVETFVGSSGRVFPKEMKAAPLLRAWLRRLREAGVRFHVRHRWLAREGGDGQAFRLSFATPLGVVTKTCDAAIFALGGGSWPQLGSDGAWVGTFRRAGLAVAPLRPSNCGFDVGGSAGDGWSEHFRLRHAGQPLKTVAIEYVNTDGATIRQQGELMISDSGVEGSLIYALSAPLREAIERQGAATLRIDLAPDRSREWIAAEVAHPRGRRSWTSHLQNRTGLKGIKLGLLREVLGPAGFADPQGLAAAIKALPLRLLRPRPLAEAISSAGGISFDEVDAALMLRRHPGLFVAGEMLDWEAPTGGYLLTACCASGRIAGHGALAWLLSATHCS